VRDVAVTHAEVPEDVIPLPPRLASDHRGAIHEVVEDNVHARRGETFVAGPIAAGATILPDFVDVLRNDEGVVVERNDQLIVEQPIGSPFLLRRDLDCVGRDAPNFLREAEGPVVDTFFEILK